MSRMSSCWITLVAGVAGVGGWNITQVWCCGTTQIYGQIWTETIGLIWFYGHDTGTSSMGAFTLRTNSLGFSPLSEITGQLQYMYSSHEPTNTSTKNSVFNHFLKMCKWAQWKYYPFHFSRLEIAFPFYHDMHLSNYYQFRLS